MPRVISLLPCWSPLSSKNYKSKPKEDEKAAKEGKPKEEEAKDEEVKTEEAAEAKEKYNLKQESVAENAEEEERTTLTNYLTRVEPGFNINKYQR